MWCEIVATLALAAVMPVVALLERDREQAIVCLCLSLPAVVVGLGVVVLERPVRAWLDRRYTRAAARGVVELEARAARR